MTFGLFFDLTKMRALETQVGGSHYQSDYQPVQLFVDLNLNAFQANIVKYVTRYKRKGGVIDLQKAIHTAEIADELLPAKFKPLTQGQIEILEKYQKANNLNDSEITAIKQSLKGIYFACAKETIPELIKNYNESKIQETN